MEPARGLRIGIVPSSQGSSDRIEQRDKLIVCPLSYDGSFMEIFYRAWGIVQQFIGADAQMPKPVALPRPEERQVAKYLQERREYPVLDVVQAMEAVAQPDLLAANSRLADIEYRREADTTAKAILAPVAQQLELFR